MAVLHHVGEFLYFVFVVVVNAFRVLEEVVDLPPCGLLAGVVPPGNKFEDIFPCVAVLYAQECVNGILGGVAAVVRHAYQFEVSPDPSLS